MTGRHLLVALVAPGSVQTVVGRVQQALFATHGLLSAVALPPIVPVAFIEPPAKPRAFLEGLERSAAAPWRARTAGAGWLDGWLFLRVETGGLWAGLRAEALARGGELAGPFPAAEGFFLGCAEARADQRDAIAAPDPAQAFSSADLALLRLETAEGTAWWRAVSWETIEERPLRGRRTR
jgi:hypothetical protein